MSEHEEEEREQSPKIKIIRIIVSAVLALALYILAKKSLLGGWALFAAWLVPYLIIGYDVLISSVKNLLKGEMLDENFLMALATVGALALRDFPEAVSVMVFYQIGDLFEDYAVDKSRDSIADMMNIRPDHARVERGGKAETVSPGEVKIGEIIEIRPGERVPLDGVVLDGNSTLDTSALTGETVPRSVQTDDDVLSGCVNLSGLLRVKVTKEFGESTVSKILDLVENASGKKAKAENFIKKFAKIYTPCVVAAAVLLTLIPSIITHNWAEWLQRSLVFLVISCPCALVISVPLSFFGGIGAASKNGVLIKGGSYIDVLSKAQTIVFDKTGTLTKGVFNVTAVHPEKVSEKQLLEYASAAESCSNHPVARSIIEACAVPEHFSVSKAEELAGRGVCAVIDGKRVCAGNGKLMDEQGISWHPCHHAGTTVHVSVDGDYAGHIVVSDEVKPESAAAITALRAAGIKKTVMLTGDAKEVGESVAKELGLDEVYSKLLPADKVERVEALLAGKADGSSLAFVGDGINDAPVLARADIGIAMGAIGSDAAIEAADIVLMDDNPGKIAFAIRLARRTMKIVKENIVFALAVKAAILALGAFGLAPMWLAVVGDVGVSVIAILNAMRSLKIK